MSEPSGIQVDPEAVVKSLRRQLDEKAQALALQEAYASQLQAENEEMRQTLLSSGNLEDDKKEEQ